MKKTLLLLLFINSTLLYAQSTFRLDKKSNQVLYNISENSSDYLNYVKLNHNAIDLEKRNQFFNWFFTQNPQENYSEFCYLFDYFPYDSSLKVFYQDEFKKKLKDTNWRQFTQEYRKKILFMNKENIEQFELEKIYVRKSIENSKKIAQSDIELIINYDLSEFKDKLKKQYFILEREYNKRRLNNEDIWIEPIHVALAKFGDKDVEELIYQRMNNKKAYSSIPNILKNIDTKNSLLKLLIFCDKAINEDKINLEKNYEYYLELDKKYKINKNYILKCGDNFYESSIKSNEIIQNFNIKHIEVKRITENDKTLNKYSNIEFVGVQENIKSVAMLLGLKALILNEIKNKK